MKKVDLETQARKAVLNINEKVTYISNVLNDLSMKLCHVIKSKRDYHDIYRDMVKGDDYLK